MEKDVAKRNARLVHIATFCAELSFATPIWLLYSTSQLNFSAALASVLFTGMWAIGALFEVPTGVIADRMGRRRSYIIGMALMALFPLTFVINPPLPLFIALIVIAGFGSSLVSGSLIPLVHASYERASLGKRHYHTFLSTNRAILFGARVVSGVLGGWMFTLYAPLPFIGWFVAMIVALSVIWFVREAREPEARALTYKAHMSEALRAILAHRIVLVAIVMYILANIYAEAIWTAYQVFYEQDGLDPVQIGTLFSVIALISAVSAFFVRHVYARLNPIYMLFLGSLLMSLTALMLYQPVAPLRIAAIVPMAIASGFLALMVSAMIQSVVPNRLQSTALSIFSLAIYLTYVVSSYLIGRVIDAQGIDIARQVIFVTAAISILVSALLTISARKDSFRLEDAA